MSTDTVQDGEVAVDSVNSSERHMTRHVRVRGKYRKPLDEDQLALAFLLFAKQLREEETAQRKEPQAQTKRRTA